jgi:hypothetical protein
MANLTLNTLSQEHLPRDGDLGHLECDAAAVADDLRAVISFSFKLVSDQPSA